MGTTAVASTNPSAIASLLENENARKHIEALLPEGTSYQRVVREAYQAAARNPAILECTPASIVLAVGQAVAWDLTIGETVHLVPFNEKVGNDYEKRLKAVRDYKGDIELVVRSGAARSIEAQCVYKNETFEHEDGTSPRILHRRIMDTKARGPLVGAYAIARLSHYNILIASMSVDEIDAIRQKHSKQWKSGEMPAWYARKTLIHQVCKAIPKNPKLASILALFDKEDEELNDMQPAAALSPAPVREIEGEEYQDDRDLES